MRQSERAAGTTTTGGLPGAYALGVHRAVEQLAAPCSEPDISCRQRSRLIEASGLRNCTPSRAKYTRRGMRVAGHLSGLLAGAVAAVLLAPATATAAPQVDGIFDLSGSPGEITEGPDGNIWATLSGSAAGNDLARISPDGTVTEFNPADLNSPVGVTSGPDGNLWLTQVSEAVRVPPADPGSAQKFAVAALTDPRGIVTGPDGNLWAASGDKLIKIPPASPASFETTDVAGMSARGTRLHPGVGIR